VEHRGKYGQKMVKGEGWDNLAYLIEKYKRRQMLKGRESKKYLCSESMSGVD
jgi:hypothetical protein